MTRRVTGTPAPPGRHDFPHNPNTQPLLLVLTTRSLDFTLSYSSIPIN